MNTTELAPVEKTSTEVEAIAPRPRKRLALLIGLVVLALVAGGVFVAAGYGWLAPIAPAEPGVALDVPVDGVREVDPDAATPVIGDFAITPAVAECADDHGGETAPLTFTWNSSDADRAWIGVGTSDASISPTAEVPLSSDGWTELEFECFLDSSDYTLTVQGPGGTTSVQITVQRTII